MENNRKSSRADVERYNLEVLLRRPSLRASFSRRVSQARRETETTPDTTCGIGCIRGQWLQSFANRTTFVFVYEVLGSFYSSYVAYFCGTITTLEKRFKFSSLALGIIACSGEISKIATCLALFFFPPKVHKPRCLFAGVFIIILSAVMFTTPHFLYDPGIQLGENNTQYKEGNCTGSHANQTNAFSVFLLTQILHGIGGGVYLTQGTSYKDDNIHLDQSPSLISMVSILKTLGPAFGYWLSSVSLKTHVNLEKATDDNGSHWIGAWWLGNLVIAFILLVVGFLPVLFPQTLPKAAVRRIFNNTRDGVQVRENNNSRGITKPIKSLLINPAFNSIHFFETFHGTFLGYFIFLPKYVEVQYRISASTANLISGSITLISAAFGIVMASSVITRYRPTARALASWCIVAGVLCICGLISYIDQGCAKNDEHIKAVSSKYCRMYDSCECGWKPLITSLPCVEISQNNITKEHNCTKALNSINDSINNLNKIDCYSNFLLFTIITCFLSFIYAGAQSSYSWLEIKNLDNTSKLHMLWLKLIDASVIVAAPIVFGYILDKTCLFRDDNSPITGNCWVYDNTTMRYMINFTAIGFPILGIIINIRVWLSVKNLKLFYDIEDDDNDDVYINNY